MSRTTGMKANVPGRPSRSTLLGRASAIDLSKLVPGNEYIVEWNDGDRQRYRVEEMRGDYVIRKRWIDHLNKWTEWNGVQKIAEITRHKITICPK